MLTIGTAVKRKGVAGLTYRIIRQVTTYDPTTGSKQAPGYSLEIVATSDLHPVAIGQRITVLASSVVEVSNV